MQHPLYMVMKMLRERTTSTFNKPMCFMRTKYLKYLFIEENKYSRIQIQYSVHLPPYIYVMVIDIMLGK